jgi:hypothetical protein
MSVALILIAVLFVFVVVVSVKGRRRRRAAREHERAEHRVTAGKAEAQKEHSVHRQADVKAAYAERASKVGRDTDE